MIRDKEILLREYSKMEIELANLTENCQDLKQRYQEIQVEFKQKEKDKVSRKDYNEVLKKLMKSKSCLEKSIKENRELRARGLEGERDGSTSRPENKLLD